MRAAHAQEQALRILLAKAEPAFPALQSGKCGRHLPRVLRTQPAAAQVCTGAAAAVAQAPAQGPLPLYGCASHTPSLQLGLRPGLRAHGASKSRGHSEGPHHVTEYLLYHKVRKPEPC